MSDERRLSRDTISETCSDQVATSLATQHERAPTDSSLEPHSTNPTAASRPSPRSGTATTPGTSHSVLKPPPSHGSSKAAATATPAAAGSPDSQLGGDAAAAPANFRQQQQQRSVASGPPGSPSNRLGSNSNSMSPSAAATPVTGSSTAANSGASTPLGTQVVKISDKGFKPTSLTVEAGRSVCFRITDPNHRDCLEVTREGDRLYNLETKRFSSAQPEYLSFSEPGTYLLRCGVHAFAKCVLFVEPGAVPLTNKLLPVAHAID